MELENMSIEELEALNTSLNQKRAEIKTKQKKIMSLLETKRVERTIDAEVDGMTPEKKAALWQRLAPVGIDSSEKVGIPQ